MAQGSAMRKVSLRNIAAHKLRLALTVLAVVLGTAFISGAFMFTNSLSNAFDSAVNNAYSGVDAVVGGEPTLQQREEIEDLPEVDRAVLNESMTVVVATGDPQAPEPVQTGGATSSLGIWYSPDEAVGEQREITEGSAPDAADEVAINATAVEQFGLTVGQDLIVVDPETRHELTISGIFERELDQGATLELLMPEQSYAERFLPEDTVGQLLIDASADTEVDDLVSAVSASFPELEVDSGEKLAEEVSQAIQNALSFVNYFLVAFGLVALLVGTFLIANTFSMIVAQRTKEFALLRALGASRKQITRSVTFEALIIGLIGSAVGVVAGIGLVALIKAFMSAQGMDMPGSGLGLSVGAVVVPIILGTLVTIVSAWAPARKAGAIQPVEAMRSTEASTSQPLGVRTAIGLVLMLAGIVLAVVGAWQDDWATATRSWTVGAGALGLIVGFFLAGPALSLPVVPTFGRLIGAPFGAIGRLAATNTQRNPRRTSTTAFALALGLALVTAIGMFGATTKASIDEIMEDNFSADFIITGPTGGNFPVPQEAPVAISEADGVAETVLYQMAPLTIDGDYGHQMGPHGITDVVSGNPSHMVRLEMDSGSAELEDGGFLAPTSLADERNWTVGNSYELAAPGMHEETKEVTLLGTFADNEIFPSVILSSADATEMFPGAPLDIAMIGVNGDGTELDALRGNLEDAVAPFVVLQVMDSEEIGGMANMAINQMMTVLYSLLALAVIIAILGIVNTLTLSVIERRQEIGMLRAVGTRRRQLRIMIVLEAIQMAIFGAIAGVLIGLALAWAFVEVLSGEGLVSAIVPWTVIAWVLGGSVIIGVLAALWPAQRAAKTPPLAAIAD